MARQRAKKPAAREIEELPRPPEELTAAQAEAVHGGIISPLIPPPGTSGVRVATKPEKPEPMPPEIQFGLPMR
jgi:hypothetical protein